MKQPNQISKSSQNDIPIPKNEPLTANEIKIILDYKDDGKIVQSIHNAKTILNLDYRLSGKIKYNELSYSPWVFGTLPWDKNQNYRDWNNADDSQLLCFLESNYGISNTEKIFHALNIVTTENKFNPVTDFLETLQWDGKPHIENLLPDFLGVKKDDYSITCMKIFMLGAISRAYKPGCKFDFLPVLIGDQGCGKSTFLRLLAFDDAFFNDNLNTVEGDKACEKLRGIWIAEMAELLAVKRSQDVEAIKSFITSTVDIYRPPYGRRTEQRPRRCVFAGTTNNLHFLTDRTGNRRYLPLMVNKQNIKKSMFENPSEVNEEFKQAWAEAMEIYKSGEFSLVFPEHLQDIVKATQEEYLEEDVRTGVIQEYLDKLNANEVCVAQIYKEALGEPGNPSRRDSNEIHDIMQGSIKGWVKMDKKKRIGAWGPQIGYHRIKEEPDNGFVMVPNEELPFL